MSTVKRLFEITCGATGLSYVRVYAWAGTEKGAVSMALDAFNGAGYACEKDDLGVQECFRDNEPGEFCTLPSDEGWER